MGCIPAEHRKVRRNGAEQLIVGGSDADAIYLHEVVVMSGTIFTEGAWRVVRLRKLRSACLAALGVGDGGARGSLLDETSLAFDN